MLTLEQDITGTESQLRYWILSQGDKIEVLSPKSMRQWVAQIAGNMNTMYLHD